MQAALKKTKNTRRSVRLELFQKTKKQVLFFLWQYIKINVDTVPQLYKNIEILLEISSLQDTCGFLRSRLTRTRIGA